MNECSDGTHTCQQVCDNTHGGFRCMCNSGFALNSDGFSCRGEYIIDCDLLVTIGSCRAKYELGSLT